MKTVASARTTGFQGLLPDLPPVGPVPLSVVRFFPPQVFQVTFDQAVVPGALNTTNWFVRWNNQSHTVTMAAAGGSTVDLSATPGAPSIGGNVVSYTAAAPLRLVGLLNGLDAPAFVDFPF